MNKTLNTYIKMRATIFDTELSVDCHYECIYIYILYTCKAEVHAMGMRRIRYHNIHIIHTNGVLQCQTYGKRLNQNCAVWRLPVDKQTAPIMLSPACTSIINA